MFNKLTKSDKIISFTEFYLSEVLKQVARNCFLKHTFYILIISLTAAPSVVRDVRITETAPNEATLTWEKPEFANGEITVYMISYQGKKEVSETISRT